MIIEVGFEHRGLQDLGLLYSPDIRNHSKAFSGLK